MKKRTLSLLIVATAIIVMQSCQKLVRIDPQCPIISSGTIAAHAGETVSIKGSGFQAGLPKLYKVNIGDQPVDTFEVPDSNTLRFKVPEGIGDGNISISLAGGATCDPPLTFIYQLTVTAPKLFASGFNMPAGMDVDANSNVILAESGNNFIKQITPAGQISTIAGNGTPGTLDNDAGSFVQFNYPDDVAVDAGGNIYVADDLNHCIRKIDNSSNHFVSTVTGEIGSSGIADNKPVKDARFERPRGIAVNGTSSAFVVEYVQRRVRYISFENDNVSTLIGGRGGPTSILNSPIRVAYSEKRDPAFPILVADQRNNRILEVDYNGKTKPPIMLAFLPQDLAVDATGNIIVLNQTGRRVSVVYKDNSVKDIAGFEINYNSFQRPSGLAIDTKNKIIYVSDEDAGTIVMIKYK